MYVKVIHNIISSLLIKTTAGLYHIIYIAFFLAIPVYVITETCSMHTMHLV